MSDIRPTSQRPPIERAPMERAKPTERPRHEAAVHNASKRAETKPVVAGHDMPQTDKPKGGHVDVRV